MPNKNNSKKRNTKNKSQKASIKKQGTNKLVPVEVAGKQSLGGSEFKIDYDIVNGPSFGSVNMKLKKNQQVVSQSGCMAFFKGNVKTETKSRGGIFSGIKRMLLTSSSMFMTTYTAEDKTNEISFQSHLPGDVLPVVVRPGEKIIISPYSLICFTDNLTLNSKRRLRGILTNEGIYQSEFENKTQDKGIVFLASYGGHQKVQLAKGEKFVLDNGLFLCSHTSTKYNVTTIGGVKTTFFSGEGLVMEFEGPCELYTQGRSVHHLINFMARHLPRNE